MIWITDKEKEKFEEVKINKYLNLKKVLKSFTRGDWIMGILQGTDLLTAQGLLQYLNSQQKTTESAQELYNNAKEYEASIAIYLRGHGNPTNVKEVEGEKLSNQLAILENRNINIGTVTIEKAAEFAENYFKEIKELLESAGKEYRDQLVESDVVKYNQMLELSAVSEAAGILLSLMQNIINGRGLTVYFNTSGQLEYQVIQDGSEPHICIWFSPGHFQAIIREN